MENIWHDWANAPTHTPHDALFAMAKKAVLAGFLEQLLHTDTAHQWPKAIDNWLTHPSPEQTQLATEAVLNQRKEAVAQWLSAWAQQTPALCHTALEQATADMFRTVSAQHSSPMQVAEVVQTVGVALPELRLYLPEGLRHTLQTTRIKWDTPSVSPNFEATPKALAAAPPPPTGEHALPQRSLPWLILGLLALGVLFYAKEKAALSVGEAPQPLLLDSLNLPANGQAVYVEVSDSQIIKCEAGSFMAHLTLTAQQKVSQPLTLSGLHFPTVEGALSETTQAVLDSVALVFKAYPTTQWQIDIPITASEMATGKNLWPAKIKAYLTSKGIAPQRIMSTLLEIPTPATTKVTDVQNILFKLKK